VKESPLVTFTLLAQTAVGVYSVSAGSQLILYALGKTQVVHLDLITLIIVLLLTVLAMAISFLHLGSPIRAYRAIFNFQTSWLSREILSISLFCACIVMQTAYSLIWNPTEYSPLVLFIICLIGVTLVFCISRVYMLRTMPAWKSWWTFLSFLSASFINGSITTLVILFIQDVMGLNSSQQISLTTLVITLFLSLFLVIEVVLVFWMARFEWRPLNYGEIFTHQHISPNLRLLVGFMLVLGFTLTVIGLNIQGLKNTPVKIGWLVSAFIVILSAETINRITFYKVGLGGRNK